VDRNGRHERPNAVFKVVLTLFQHGAHLAVKSGNPELVELSLSHGYDPKRPADLVV